MSVTSLNIVVLSPEIRHPKQTNKQTNRKLLHFSKLEFRSTSSNKGCLYPSELWWWGEGRAVGTAQCRGSQPTWHAFSTSPPPPTPLFLSLTCADERNRVKSWKDCPIISDIFGGKSSSVSPETLSRHRTSNRVKSATRDVEKAFHWENLKSNNSLFWYLWSHF